MPVRGRHRGSPAELYTADENGRNPAPSAAAPLVRLLAETPEHLYRVPVGRTGPSPA
ncbi:hypothetical protein [Streptomyces klenkii]|uniref:hypothetical protein n=1 Tax=Streptomyces klenkii TaxID=1420899 RepID=UPI001319CEC9|nr:hypothetical protein [Streptomyces klenkii]